MSSSKSWASFIFDWLNQVRDDPATSASEFWVAFALSQFFNKKTRSCFPLQSTLAKECRVSDRTVREYLAGLARRGHLRVKDRGRDQSSIYTAVLQDRKKSSGHHEERPEENCHSLSEEDRKFSASRPEVLRTKTGRKLPVEHSLKNQSSNTVRGAPSARQRETVLVERSPYRNADGEIEIPF